MRTAFLALCASAVLFAQQPTNKLAIGGLDPVLLVQGQEVAGKDEVVTLHKGFLYRFSTAANKTAFEAEPWKWEIQYDGACARMGPASGLGDPSRWIVHEGKIYIFASDQCKAGFAADPKAHVEPLYMAPSLDTKQRQEGDKVMLKAIKAHGGEAKLAAVASFEVETVADPEKEGAQPVTYRILFAKPDKLRREATYSGWGTLTDVVSKTEAFSVDPKAMHPMRESQREAVKRSLQLHPLAVLVARERPDFLSWPDGKGEIGGKPVDYLGIYFDGVLARVAIDRKSNRIAAMSYKARANGPVVDVERVFSDYKDVDGITLPFRADATAAGKPWPGGNRTVKAIRINPSIPETQFRPQ